MEQRRCEVVNEFQTRERFLHIALPLVVTVIANIIAVSTLNIGARCRFLHIQLTAGPLLILQSRFRNDAHAGFILFFGDCSTLMDLW
jgi:hypothetical protein